MQKIFWLLNNSLLESLSSHEFEEIYGETNKIYNIGIKYVEQTPQAMRGLLWSERFLTSADQAGDEEVVLVPVQTFWSEKKLPFALLKPFGELGPSGAGFLSELPFMSGSTFHPKKSRSAGTCRSRTFPSFDG